MEKIKIGDTIKIIKMDGEPHYTDREGVVTHIDDASQIHGTWGGCAIVSEVDEFIILEHPVNEYNQGGMNAELLTKNKIKGSLGTVSNPSATRTK